MLDALKSITEKLNKVKNSKLTHVKLFILNISFCLLPFLLIFIMEFSILLIIIIPLLTSILCGILEATNIKYFFQYIIVKTELFRNLNKEEKKLLEKKKIHYSLKYIDDTLLQIRNLCINEVSSEKELKEILLFILNDENIEKKLKIKIIETIEKNKYCNEKLIDIIYTEEINFKVFNYKLSDSFAGTIQDKLMDLIYNKSSLYQIIKYESYQEELSAEKIVNKILKTFDIKSLIKIIFEKDKSKLNNEEKEINYFFNNLDIEKFVNIKIAILNKVLYLKEIDNIKNYEEEFFQLAKRLDVNKKMLYIMEENLVIKEELKIINI